MHHAAAAVPNVIPPPPTASPLDSTWRAAPGDEPDTDFQLLGLPTVDENDAPAGSHPLRSARVAIRRRTATGRPSDHGTLCETFSAARHQDPRSLPVLAMLEHARTERESRALRRNMPGAVSILASWILRTAPGNRSRWYGCCLPRTRFGIGPPGRPESASLASDSGSSMGESIRAGSEPGPAAAAPHIIPSFAGARTTVTATS
jgi:hypothetical protein